MSKRALSTGGNVKESLKWEVFVAPGIPTVAGDLPQVRNSSASKP